MGGYGYVLLVFCVFIFVGGWVAWGAVCAGREVGEGGGGEGYLLCCGESRLFSKLCVFDW